jgi:hypothetical protein
MDGLVAPVLNKIALASLPACLRTYEGEQIPLLYFRMRTTAANLSGRLFFVCVRVSFFSLGRRAVHAVAPPVLCALPTGAVVER